MKLKYEFNVVEIDDSKIAVPIGDNASEFSCVLNLNQTGAAIFELLMQGDDEATIVTKLQEQYDNDSEVPAYVHEFLGKLTEGGVLA